MAKFVHAFLPDAKKPYNLKAVFQPELDIHGIASKAEVYNIEADPRVIEEGFTAACELIYYLAADGYKIKTPVFNLRATALTFCIVKIFLNSQKFSRKTNHKGAANLRFIEP
ncbi:MAG: hypothetical protein LBP80_09485 [Treponema sp.]|jgi:hypothetical protein|nr:hypothetical protein [Treponema sp.]